MRRHRAAPSEIERAVSVVRFVLVALISVVVIGVLATASRSRIELVVELVPVAMILAGAGVLSLASVRTRPGSAGPRPLGHWVFHAFDTFWFVGLTFVLSGVKPETAWVILVLPVVVASLRLDYTAVIATWLMTAAAYAAGSRLNVERFSVGVEAMLDRLGILLAVAACIALLTRWLQLGWSAQAVLTAEAERRNERFSVIENAAREMRAVPSTRVIDICLDSVVQVGFDAATLSIGGAVTGVAGRGAIVPGQASIAASPPATIEVTHWLEAGVPLWSVSIAGPRPDNVVTGWATAEVDDGLARSIADLVANATGAIQAADHLERARFDANHDHLTGLSNRALLDERLIAVTKPPRPVAIIFIDVDHFKPVNDVHGHGVGDRLLAALGSRISEAAGKGAEVARYGGDEFVVLLPDVEIWAAEAIAERIRRAAAQPFAVDGIDLAVSASIGVAIGRPTSAATAAILLKRADEAAFLAKQGGRNRVCLSRPAERPAKLAATSRGSAS